MSETNRPTDSDASTDTSDSPEAKILHMGGVSVELGPGSTRHDFESGAIGFTDVTVSDLWHLSVRPIEKFEDDKGTDEASKHGKGTYVGGGGIAGANLDALRAGEHNRYDLKFHGNILVASFVDYDDAAWELESVVAETGSEPPTGAPGKMINQALREHEIYGVKYDGFVLFTDPDAHGPASSEGVIFYSEKCLETVSQSVIPNPAR